MTLPTRDEIGARVTATARQGRRFWVLRVKFRARVAVTDGTTAYNIRVFPPSKRRGRSATGVTQRTIRAGELVEYVFKHLIGGGGPNGVTVGRYRLTIP